MSHNLINLSPPPEAKMNLSDFDGENFSDMTAAPSCPLNVFLNLT